MQLLARPSSELSQFLLFSRFEVLIRLEFIAEDARVTLPSPVEKSGGSAAHWRAAGPPPDIRMRIPGADVATSSLLNCGCLPRGVESMRQLRNDFSSH